WRNWMDLQNRKRTGAHEPQKSAYAVRCRSGRIVAALARVSSTHQLRRNRSQSAWSQLGIGAVEHSRPAYGSHATAGDCALDDAVCPIAGGFSLSATGAGNADHA